MPRPRPLKFFGARHAGYALDSSVLNPILGIGSWVIQHTVYIGARTKAEADATAQKLRIPLPVKEMRILTGNDVEAMRAANLLQAGAVYAAAGTGSGSSKLVRVLGRGQFELIGDFDHLGAQS